MTKAIVSYYYYDIDSFHEHVLKSYKEPHNHRGVSEISIELNHPDEKFLGLDTDSDGPLATVIISEGSITPETPEREVLGVFIKTIRYE